MDSEASSDMAAPVESPADADPGASDPQKAAPVAEETRAGGDGLRLAERYVVQPSVALPDHGSPEAMAVAALDTRGAARSLMALIAPRHLGLREDVLGTARRIERAHVLRVVEWGVIGWPTPGGERQRQPVVIVERPGGGRLMPRDDGQVDPLGEEALIRRVLRPLVNALRDIHGAGIVHRAIRPDNIFWRDGSGTEAVLGEGWVGLPGFGQPVCCETIGHGMALPAGRGAGRAPDDLYSLGASLAMLLGGVNPVARLDRHAVVAAKIQQGSFAVLAGNLRLSTAMAEVLRGLLADDPDDRWTLEDIELWFDGRRLSPKAPNLPAQAARPLTFCETNYWSRQYLAHGLAAQWTQATGFIAEAGLGVWLRRSLGEEKRSALMESALSGGGESGRSGADHQLARVLMILDPTAPVRLRDVAVQFDGVGPLLADSLDRGPLLQQVVQLVTQKLPAIWVELQEDPKLEHGQVRKSIDMMNYFLGKTGPGFGVERCLYETNPGLPCRSPIFDGEYVTRIQDLLASLDRVASRAGSAGNLIDRHVAAFIGARLGSAADIDLTRFGTAERLSDRCVGLLRVLALVQQSTGLYELPGLGAWVAQQLKPLIESFHHRPFKEALAKEVGPLCYRGDFAGLVRVVENDGLRQRDDTGFEAARKQYAALQGEADWIRDGGLTSTQRLNQVARQAAAIAAGAIAAVASGAVTVFLLG